MQRRFYLGIGLLLMILILGIAICIAMKAIHEPSQQLLQQAAQASLSGDMEQAVPMALEAYGRWKKYRWFTASVADHSPMDDTENLFAEMLVFADAGETAHFSSCCLQLSNMTKAMYDAHSLTGWNLL